MSVICNKDFQDLYADQYRDLSRLAEPRLASGMKERGEGFSYGGVYLDFRSMRTAPGLQEERGFPYEADSTIRENRDFAYPVFVPERVRNSRERSSSVIILLHGLNERRWLKYLPWGYTLCSRTGSVVMIMPIAFHLNRSPQSWSMIRSMMPLARLRKAQDHGNSAVSFANAALSQRLEEYPGRFVSGGMQTVGDIELLLREIRGGSDPQIASDARIDFFGYSIGCSLTEGLLMADSMRPSDSRLLSDSRAVLFCGGSLLEYSNPVSKAIIDQRANGALQQFFYHYGRDESGNLLYGGPESVPVSQISPWKLVFSSLMRAEFAPLFRLRRLQDLQRRMQIYTIPTDTVFTGDAVGCTFSGTGLESDILQLPELEGSSHEVPFPICDDTGKREAVQAVYHGFFGSVGEFLSL